MEAKFFDSLFEGDSPVGVKFGMGLTGGDFWPRALGCYDLYCSADGISSDVEGLVAVVDAGSASITISDSVVSQSAGEFLFLLLAVNGCGDEENGSGSVLRLKFDEVGEMVLPGSDGFLRAGAVLGAGGRVRVVWLYSPLGQSDECAEFSIYSNGGIGQVNLQEAVGTVECRGCGVYVFQSSVLDAGCYVFSVVAKSKKGIEISSSELVSIEVSDSCETVSLPLSMNRV